MDDDLEMLECLGCEPLHADRAAATECKDELEDDESEAAEAKVKLELQDELDAMFDESSSAAGEEPQHNSRSVCCQFPRSIMLRLSL